MRSYCDDSAVCVQLMARFLDLSPAPFKHQVEGVRALLQGQHLRFVLIEGGVSTEGALFHMLGDLTLCS